MEAKSQYNSHRLILAYYNQIRRSLNMWQSIKDAILGSRIFQRTNSVDVQSKNKRSLQKKKPLSFDSKQKEHRDALINSQKNQRPEVLRDDDICTIKKYPYSKEFVEKSNMKHDFSIISDLDDEWLDQEIRPFTVHQHSDIVFEDATLENKQKTSSSKGLKMSVRNMQESAMRRSSIVPQPQSNGKILIERKLSPLKVKRIGQICVICDRNLNIEDSFQLACTHRCHHHCGIQMQWRMRYNCDSCEVKKDYNRGSIILNMRRKHHQ